MEGSTIGLSSPAADAGRLSGPPSGLLTCTERAGACLAGPWPLPPMLGRGLAAAEPKLGASCLVTACAPAGSVVAGRAAYPFPDFRLVIEGFRGDFLWVSRLVFAESRRQTNVKLVLFILWRACN
jgi:hypothetical protein